LEGKSNPIPGANEDKKTLSQKEKKSLVQRKKNKGVWTGDMKGQGKNPLPVLGLGGGRGELFDYPYQKAGTGALKNHTIFRGGKEANRGDWLRVGLGYRELPFFDSGQKEKARLKTGFRIRKGGGMGTGGGSDQKSFGAN